jgi:hypothetical protein
LWGVETGDHSPNPTSVQGQLRCKNTTTRYRRHKAIDDPGGFIGPGTKIRGLQTAESNEPLGYFGHFAELTGAGAQPVAAGVYHVSWVRLLHHGGVGIRPSNTTLQIKRGRVSSSHRPGRRAVPNLDHAGNGRVRRNYQPCGQPYLSTARRPFGMQEPSAMSILHRRGTDTLDTCVLIPS